MAYRYRINVENAFGVSRGKQEYECVVPYERRELSARMDQFSENRLVNGISLYLELGYRRQLRISEERISELETRDQQQLKKRIELIQENEILSATSRRLQETVRDLRKKILEMNDVKCELKYQCKSMQSRLESLNENFQIQTQSAIEFHTRMKNDTIIILQGKVEKLEQDKNEMTEDFDKISNLHRCEIDELTEELRRERLNANVKHIEADETNKQLRGTIADLRNKLEKLLHDKKLNENCIYERDSRQSIENSKLQNESDQLQNEVKRLSKQLVKIKEEAEFKEREYARMEKTMTENNVENTKLKNSDQMLRDKNSELQNRVERLLHDKTKLADALKHEKDSRKKKESYENSSLKEENRKLHMEVEQLHRKTEILNDKLTHTVESAKKKEIECIQLQKMSTEKNIEQAYINAADVIQRKLREQISELEHKVDQLLNDNKMLTEKIRHEKDTVTKKDLFENSELKEKKQKIQNEFDELYHENQSLKQQLKHEKENFKLKEKECVDMHQKMKSQEEHGLNLNATNVRAKQLDERNAELNNEIQRLRQERSNITDELKQEREVRKKLEQYGNKTLQETNQTLRNDVTQLRFQNERLREDLTREKDNFKKMEKEFLKRSSDMKEKLEKQEQELQRQTKKLSEQSVLNRNVDPGAKKTQADLQQLDETRARLKNVQKELDDAKSRLSRAMGDKLTDNNPNIADLSDKNRPTKISERYQELYDNQWTDAFEIVNGKYGNEENTINVLRDILMDTLEYCKTQAASQMIQIRASFLKGEDLPENMKKQVKECRKAMAELYGKGLYREYCDQLRTSKPESMSTPSYVKECFEICWLMAVQDPPVEFGPDLHRGDTFNKEHYRAYTRSGERVDFVVWPVLLLHQNGPVLCKGVAQGK